MWLVRYLGLFVNQSKESWELKMWWLQGGNNTLTACPRQVIAFWKCQSCLLPLPPPSPPKKMNSHSLQFLPGDAVVTRDIKDSAQAIWGWGGGGGLKVGINKACDRRFKSGELCCFPVSFFLLCLVDPTS